MTLRKEGGSSSEGFERKTVNSADRHICPCIYFSSSDQVVSALSSEQKTLRFIKWIKGEYCDDDLLEFEKIPLSKLQICERNKALGPQEGGDQPTKCVNRVGAAYCILNAIRDGCRYFIEKEVSDPMKINISNSIETAKVPTADEPKYEEAFPSLGSSSQTQPITSTLKPKKKAKKKIKTIQLSSSIGSKPSGNLVGKGDIASVKINEVKTKRRIRPAPVSANQHTWGNIAALQTEAPSPQIWPKPITKNKSTNMKQSDPMSRIMSDKYVTPIQLGSKSASLSAAAYNPLNDPIRRISPVPVHASVDAFPPATIEPVKMTKKTDAVKDESVVQVTPDEMKVLLQNTANAYCAIITNQLAPSSVVELQLIIRMLAVRDSVLMADENETNRTQGLEKLFKNPSICRLFASKVLQKLQNLILNLHRDVLVSMLGMKGFANQLPDLAMSIHLSLESHRNALQSEGKYGQDECTTSLAVSGKTTILTMPFQEKRDSRHNYRSRDQTSLYNNREQCRDSFLSQLRAFQQMRGTVLNPSQVEQSLDNIIHALRQTMEQLLPTNTHWFAELFTDLLLQIGLVPMQELDADILKNVADKERLQKLHSRFTSKVAQKNKSSRALVLRGKDISSGPSPDEFFTEHQEFFFLFIKSVDSYIFSSHLQRRLVTLLLKLSSIHEGRGLERRISELKMLSKFLGFLVFSPNWNMNPHGQVEEPCYSHFAPVIAINDIVIDAYKEGILTLVIPWVLEFLRMMSWDSVSKKLPYYNETFSLLRRVQKQISTFILEGYSPLGSNMLLLEIQLDVFFSEVTGLVEAELLGDYELLPRAPNNQKSRSLDILPFNFSPTFVFSSSTHLDDLNKLVADLSHEGKLVAMSGTSKKLKPHILSTSRISSPSNLLQSDPFAPLSAFDRGKLQGFFSKSTTAEKRHEPEKLVDAFFHQHKHLQQLCEFVIDYCIDHVLAKRSLEECIIPVVQRITVVSTSSMEEIPDPIDLDWYLHVMGNIEKGAMHNVSLYTQMVLEDYIVNAMKALVPSYVDATLKDIATRLSIDHGLRKGEVLVNSMVRNEAKKALDLQLQTINNGKVHQNVNGKDPNPKPSNHIFIERARELINEQNSSQLCVNKIKALHPLFLELSGAGVRDGRVLDLTASEVVISLAKVLTHQIKGLTNQSANIHDIEMPNGFNEILHLMVEIARTGFAREDVSIFGSILSTPIALRKIVHQIDGFRIIEECIGGRVLQKSDLSKGLFNIIENYPMSQQATSTSLRIIRSVY